MVKRTEYKHTSGTDGLELALLRIEPEEDAEVKGILQLVHGMCEHKERYETFMRFMAKRGWICVIHDHRGHGGSVKDPADLGYMYEGGYEALIEDIHEITLETKEYAKERCGEKKLPFTLLGHSMGSMAVRCYIRKYDAEIDRLCVLGCPSKRSGMRPGLAVAEALTRIHGERAHSAYMDKLVFGAIAKPFKNERMDNAWINSDRSEVEKYNADPLCGFRFTLNGYVNLIKLTMLTYKEGGYAMNNKTMPIRFFSGDADPFGISRWAIGRAVLVLKRAGYVNARWRTYNGMRHEILLEKNRGRVYRDLYEFISGEKG